MRIFFMICWISKILDLTWYFTWVQTFSRMFRSRLQDGQAKHEISVFLKTIWGLRRCLLMNDWMNTDFLSQSFVISVIDSWLWLLTNLDHYIEIQHPWILLYCWNHLVSFELWFIWLDRSKDEAVDFVLKKFSGLI